MNTALTAPAEFRTDTRALKQGFLFITGFVLIAFFASALYGGTSWHEALGVSVSLSAILLGVLWLYGIFQMFDRRYVVSPDGVSLFRREQLLQHIPWSEVHSIRRGHLQVCARGGRRISFNLPPPIQRQARQTIDALYQQSRNS
jgi:hypothetical protein